MVLCLCFLQIPASHHHDENQTRVKRCGLWVCGGEKVYAEAMITPYNSEDTSEL